MSVPNEIYVKVVVDPDRIQRMTDSVEEAYVAMAALDKAIEKTKTSLRDLSDGFVLTQEVK